MANPRQRRKARSSTHKAVSHSRHAKRNLKKTPPIRGPKVLQDAWDKTKTVSQNYMALGLACNLNPSAAGGVERLKGHQNLVEASAPQAPSVPYTPSEIPRGYGRIIRDESGNVLGIEMSETDTTNSQNSDQGQRDLNPPIDEMLLARWAVNLGGGATKSVPSERQDTFLRELELISSVRCGSTTLSASISGVGPRHASAGEVAYLEKLVFKYGTDVERMAKDRRLNPEQRTSGELRRALKRVNLLVN